MKKCRPYILIIIFSYSFLFSHAQLFTDYNFKFRTYTSNDGLVHNSVHKCIADSKGFLWIITENGLSRFDGYQFKNFQHINDDSTSLPVNDLSDILIDNKDRVWLAYKDGCCYYDPSTHHFIALKNNGIEIPAENLAYDSSSNTVFIGSSKGLIKYNIDQKNFSTTSLSHALPNAVTCMLLDREKNLWITILRNGYYKYDPAKDTAVYFDTGEWPTNIYQDKEGILYLSTWDHGMKMMTSSGIASKEDHFLFTNDSVSAPSYIYQGCMQNETLTGDDIIWVITQAGGIALFSKQQKKLVKIFRYQPQLVNGIKTDFMWSIYTAPDGTLWICTWHGLVKVNNLSQQFQSEELPELNSNFYNCVSGIMDDPYDNSKVWMSVNGGGIAQYNKKEGAIKQWFYHNFPNSPTDKHYLERWVVNLFKDSNNTIWSGSYGGFIKISKGSVSFKALPRDNDYTFTSCNYRDRQDMFWQMGRFLLRFNPYTEQYDTWLPPKNKSGQPSRFLSVSEKGNGNMFTGTNDGLFELDPVKNIFKAIPFYTNFSDTAIWKNIKALQTIDDKLYIGTLRGLAVLDINSGECKVIGKENYIARVDQNALHKDVYGKLWIYSKNGLYRYDPVTGNITKFTADDGIYNTSNDAAFFFEYDNSLYLGFRMAYTKFDPSLVNSNSNKPVPYITAVKAGGVYLNINTDDYRDQQLSLNYEQSNVSFDFTAIEYNNPEKINFSYMLEGFDKKWIEAGAARVVSYTNLPGGKYIFKVKAGNSSGLFSEHDAEFRIKIIPPFWKTAWFLIVVFSLLALLLFMLISRRIKNIKAISATRQQVTELEMKSLRSQMNPHFIFNSLNSIHKYIWENKQEDASEYLTKFSKLVRMILENSKEKEIPLSKELETLRLYIELEHRRCNNKFDYSITVDPSINSANVLIPSMIIQPYVENAIWHGLVQKEGHGNLTINIRREKEQLACIIEDDGIGRKKAAAIKAQKKDIHHSMGLDITQQRLHLLSKESGAISSVRIEDVEDGQKTGTKVILQLPLNMMY
ncbi:MAG: histidine kinase [Ferruginibacter sp.]